MPRKIRALIKDLKKAGWVLDHLSGSHRVFKHPRLSSHVSLSGHDGDDAQHYQEKTMKAAVNDAQRQNQ